MCRSLVLLSDIANATIDDLLVFMKRRLKIYGIFFVIEIVTFIASKNYQTTLLAFTVTTLVLYILSMGAIAQFLKNPTSTTALGPLICATIVLIFNVFDMVYTLITEKDYWALFSLISIALQISTLILVYKLREKLLDRELGREDQDVQLEQPIENSSAHSSTHSSRHGSKNMNSSKHMDRSAHDIENPLSKN